MGAHAFAARPECAVATAAAGIAALDGLGGVEEQWDIAVGEWKVPALDGVATPVCAHHTLTFHRGGSPVRLVGGRDVKLRGGEFMMKVAGAEYAWHSRGDYQVWHFYLRPDFLESVAAQSRRRPLSGDFPDLRRAERQPDLARLLGAYVARANDRAAPPPMIEMDARAMLIGIGLIDALAPDAGGSTPDRARPASSRKGLERAIEFIEAHHGQALRLAAIAEKAGLSPYHFARMFKAETGSSVHQYVMQRRIERARALLAAGRMPIAEVALACGFASQAHLTDTFRKHTGQTPGEFRRQAG